MKMLRPALLLRKSVGKPVVVCLKYRIGDGGRKDSKESVIPGVLLCADVKMKKVGRAWADHIGNIAVNDGVHEWVLIRGNAVLWVRIR